MFTQQVSFIDPIHITTGDNNVCFERIAQELERMGYNHRLNMTQEIKCFVCSVWDSKHQLAFSIPSSKVCANGAPIESMDGFPVYAGIFEGIKAITQQFTDQLNFECDPIMLSIYKDSPNILVMIGASNLVVTS